MTKESFQEWGCGVLYLGAMGIGIFALGAVNERVEGGLLTLLWIGATSGVIIGIGFLVNRWAYHPGPKAIAAKKKYLDKRFEKLMVRWESYRGEIRYQNLRVPVEKRESEVPEPILEILPLGLKDRDDFLRAFYKCARAEIPAVVRQGMWVMPHARDWWHTTDFGRPLSDSIDDGMLQAMKDRDRRMAELERSKQLSD